VVRENQSNSFEKTESKKTNNVKDPSPIVARERLVWVGRELGSLKDTQVRGMSPSEGNVSRSIEDLPPWRLTAYGFCVTGKVDQFFGKTE